MTKIRVHFSVDNDWFDIYDKEIKDMKFEDLDELTEYLQERAIEQINWSNVVIESDDLDAIVEDCNIGELEDEDDE